MALKLYYDAMSQPSRALLLFVRVTKIPCQEMPVALRKGEHKTEEFAKINPFQRVPVILHDGSYLTESVAILRYLCRTFPVPDHWYPKDTKAQAKVDEYMEWQHLNLRAFGSMYFQTKLLQPLIKGEPPNEKRVARFQRSLEECLGQMETVWLKDRPFVAGHEITIADLLAVTELEQPQMAGFDVRKGHPILAAYMDKVREELGPNTYDEVHKYCFKVKKQFAQVSQASKL